MPIYENRSNAENRIVIPEEIQKTVLCERRAVLDRLVEIFVEGVQGRKGTFRIAFDGWYGVDYHQILDAVFECLPSSIQIEVRDINQSGFSDEDTIAKYKKEFITDDPGFGKVNTQGKLEDLLDEKRIAELKKELISANQRDTAIVVVGPGAACPQLIDLYDDILYFDKTADPMLWKMWCHELIPFGAKEPSQSYFWKEYYYCDFYLLQRHKETVLPKMTHYLEGIEADQIKLMPRNAYDAIIKETVKYPIKQIKTYSPGPWGAYRYRDFWDIPGLECNAWNRLAGADLSILISVGDDKVINMPTTNLLRYADSFVGPHIAEQYPGLIPLEIWLDDGYFPKPKPAERTSMPVHNHPDTSYVKRHFNEPLGRYETYYIVEAYQGANTWMGFKEDADLEVWEEKCRESERTGKPIEDWKDFIANWETNVGDLFLIPPGTTHCHGGNQMVLEMDTCPSVAGAEYSFFSYDFRRPTWNDVEKKMNGKPMKMHLEHNFDNNRYCREEWVQKNLRARARVIKWTKEYWIDRFSTYGPMPFQIERIHFRNRGEYTTGGRFIHAVTLTVGENVTIRSISDPEKETNIDFFQTSLIPAGFGDYEIVNSNKNGGVCTVTLWRWKVG